MAIIHSFNQISVKIQHKLEDTEVQHLSTIAKRTINEYYLSTHLLPCLPSFLSLLIYLPSLPASLYLYLPYLYLP